MRRQLIAAVRDATLRVIGQDLVKNDAEARLLIAVIRAFGDAAAGFVYAAPSRAQSSSRPPDVVLCHPDVGLLVIEAKGLPITQIQGIEAGAIFVRYEGYNRPDNVVRQVEDQLFKIELAMMKLVRDRRAKPLTNCLVAFPIISEGDWVSRGYDKALPGGQLLFREQIDDPQRLRRRVLALMAGKQTAAIAIDDLTRPTPTHRVLPVILDELAAAGMKRDRVRIVVASGSHRPATRPDLVRKIGETMLNQVETYVHNPYEGLTYLGTTQRGIPVYTNRFFHEADFKVGVGCALPHEIGFSGGKLIGIGLSGLATIEAFHYGEWERAHVGIGKMEGNECQEELYAITDMVGLDVLVNVVVNSQREAAGIFAGSVAETHRQAIILARRLYATLAPKGADIVILNAYPKDTDLIQATMAINVAYLYNREIVRPGGRSWSLQPVVREPGSISWTDSACDAAPAIRRSYLATGNSLSFRLT